MFRITNQMMYNNSLVSMYSQNEGLFKSSEQISSGKRVNRPSDDPLAIGEIMNSQTRLDRNDRYATFTQKAKSMLGTSESLIASTTDVATRSRELAMGQASGTSTPQTRLTTSYEIDNLLQNAIQTGNAQFGSDFLFSGRTTNIAPVAQNGNYQGDPLALNAPLNENATIAMTVKASDFLTADMSPKLTLNTPLSSTKLGQGVGTGTFTITDRAGVTGTVNVTAGMTVGNLITAINSSGANVTASLPASSTYSFQIVDNNTATVTGPVRITDTAGKVASALGIAGSRPLQTMKSDSLRPAITAGTAIADLYGGAGVPLSDISVINGATSATVTFAGASTVGDVINAINASSANVTAGINANGTSMTLTSNNPATVAYAKDINAGKEADLLGIGGGRNLILNLQRLSTALKINDVRAISGLLDNFSSSINTTAALRGDIGARINRLDTNTTQLDTSRVDITTTLSNAQDTDMAKAISDFSLLQSAYQATARATAQIIQPSLLNFLK